MSEPASISAGIADRYATAIFDIVKENNNLPALASNLDDLRQAIADSADLRDMLDSPLLGRDEQGAAITAVAEKMGLIPSLQNALGLMAAKRRLFVVPAMVTRLAEMIAEDKGEVTAEVRTAKALTKTQSDKLAKTLEDSVGKKVSIQSTVDESLIGGLVVKVGSKMIDTSIASKLNSLQNAMKEVG